MSEEMTILTTVEVAEMLRLHPMTVCKYAKEGKIPCIQLGRVYRFRKEDIEDWLKNKMDLSLAS